MSHLLSLLTIEEESVPSVQTEAKGRPRVPRVKRNSAEHSADGEPSLLSNQNGSIWEPIKARNTLSLTNKCTELVYFNTLN